MKKVRNTNCNYKATQMHREKHRHNKAGGEGYGTYENRRKKLY